MEFYDNIASFAAKVQFKILVEYYFDKNLRGLTSGVLHFLSLIHIYYKNSLADLTREFRTIILIYAGSRIIVGENLFISPTFVDGVSVGSGLTHTDPVAVSVGGKNKIVSVAGKGKSMAFQCVI